MSKPSAIIIGAGIAGIASSIRFAIKGYNVSVFEENEKPGGKLGELSLDGFRFDTGPSLFTMPQYVDELFILAGKNPRNYFDYFKLEEICRYFYEDGLRLNAFAEVQKFADEVGNKTESNRTEVLNFLKKSEKIYEVTDKVFLQRSLHKVKSYLHWDTLKSVLNFGKIDAFRTQSEANNAMFSDERVTQLFNRYATYNGSNPFQAPATLNVIPHFEYGFGAFLPNDGMYSIVNALVKLARELGVKFSFKRRVDEIIYSDLGKGQRVEGVRCDGKIFKSTVVVSNLDIYFTYNRLLKNMPAPKKILSQERSSSALIFYWGIRGNFPELDVHNILFSQNYEEEFDYIWKEKSISPDPTIYINITSKIIRGDAPQDCENWFVMINVPANDGQVWEKLISTAKINILKKINRTLKIDIEKHIICERILDPIKIEENTGSFQGSLYGNSSNNQFAAFLRHPNFSSKIDNLYFCGGSVHPGGGIPLALLSAKIIDELS
ncbi:phytoene desaturase [Pedobacter sp. UYEF25]